MGLAELSPDQLRACVGIGVAGNFAGHLEQAGEDREFSSEASDPAAPKGIFPFFVPDGDDLLAQYPLSSQELRLPPGREGEQVQLEPEAALFCGIEYDDLGAVAALRPRLLAAFNDCSIRRENAAKLSEKKNWGTCSTGVAARGFVVDELDRDGSTAPLRLASFLRRDGDTHAYGVDSKVAKYSYYGDQLLDWLVERLRNQAGGDRSPLEPVGDYLRDSGGPAHALIGLGATRYTDYGERHYLQHGDESLVLLYDEREYSSDEVAAAVAAGRERQLTSSSTLCQRVVAH